MKEIDKLAEEYASPFIPGASGLIAGAYIAGFRKAREMAQEIAHGHSHKDLCDEGECESFHEVCDAVHDISCMGESEVTEKVPNA